MYRGKKTNHWATNVGPMKTPVCEFISFPVHHLNVAVVFAGNLANYQAKYAQDYMLGVSMAQEEPRVSRPEPRQPEPNPVMVKPAEEDDTSTWSSSTTSDLLF